MTRWFCALVTGGVLSGFALLLLTGQYANDGPVVLPLSQEHGLHAGDLFVVGGWVVAMLALGWLVARGADGDPAPVASRAAPGAVRPGDVTDAG
jgi:hypothetical protein